MEIDEMNFCEWNQLEWMKASLMIVEELTAAQPIPQWKLNGMLMKLSLIWWRDGVELKGQTAAKSKTTFIKSI